MRRWMQSVPLKRAYTVSTIGYTVPLLILAIILVFYVHSTTIADTDAAVQQAQLASKAGQVATARVTAHPEFTDITKEFALIVLVTALLGGLLTKALLTNVLMKETYVLVDATR